MRLFIFILFIGFSWNSYAQQTLNVVLDWKEIQSIQLDESNSISRLYFEGAVYNELLSTEPYYVQSIPVKDFYDNYTIKLQDIQFEELNAFEKVLLPSTLPQAIEIKHNHLVSAAKKHFEIRLFPFFTQNGKKYKLLSAQIVIKGQGNAIKSHKGNTYADESVLATGKWYKVKVSTDGIHRITASEYASMGFGSATPISHVRLYGNGGGVLSEVAGERLHDDLVENAIYVHDANANQLFDNNDYLLFYGKGPVNWKFDKSSNYFKQQQHHYDNYAYYFVTSKNGQGKRVSSNAYVTDDPDILVNQFLDYKVWEKDSLNLIKSGKTWFGKKFDIKTQYSTNFNFPNVNTDSLVMVEGAFAARSFSSSTMYLNVNGQSNNIPISSVSASSQSGFYARYNKGVFQYPATSSLFNVKVTYSKPTNSSFGWMDYVLVNAWRHLTMSGKQISFSNPYIYGQSQLAEYQITNPTSNLKVWDVTNPLEPIELGTSQKQSNIIFKDSTMVLKRYCAFSGDYLSVTNVGTVTNQNLHALEDIEYLIVSHPDFLSVAEKIKEFHEAKNGYKVYITTASPIYNEFSSGAKDASSIRDFVKMLYDRANQNGGIAPRYLLLLGDGSYDNKNRLNDNTNYILTMQSSESMSISGSYTSDDFFGILDDGEGANGSGALDIGVGRFPVSSLEQANQILNKIYRYTATHLDSSNQSQNNCAGGSISVGNMADWRNLLVFVGDDEDGMTHTKQADQLSEYINNNYPKYNVNKIYFDAYPQITVPGGQRYPEAKRDILNQVEKGALVVSYTGHGGEVGWAHESVLEVGDILDMSNYHNLPAFITATCEFSRFDDPERTSAGEYVLLNPNGGGIALFTTTRLAYSGSNFALSQAFFRKLFVDIDGEKPAFGDLIRLAKVGSGNSYSNRNFVLLGDPGLKLSYPKLDVVTTEINNIPVDQAIDTLSALSLVSIKGQIVDNGQVVIDFNGTVYPTIYDKPKSYNTLGQDAGSYAYNFDLQNNILYKGKSEVVNGEFEFTFMVPKDISYSYGLGKISYYAENGLLDAHGAFDSIVIGGSSGNVHDDQFGPQISLFINDSNFVSGGITNENPLLLAYLFDEHGINTTGNGIGHDVVAILDGNSQNPIILNDYYQASLNSYQRGSVRFPFQNLSKGKHTLSIKVWDIYNNSSTASIEFYVEESNQMTISNLHNFPNPFIDQTSFVFEHNQACEVMEVEVYIYDMVGRLVDKLQGEANCDGYKISSTMLQWDGTNDNGSPLPKGMYIYKLRVRTNLTDWTVATNKMIIMR